MTNGDCEIRRVAADVGGPVGDELGEEWFEEAASRIQQLVAAAMNATPILRLLSPVSFVWLASIMSSV